ncbi:WGR domain-containing protein [Acidiphilium sp. C61]|uniref:WGR domain-containing protein n=1 Tax=Acidiphilium sp. C61 TaxID=1671485 RepID=UPI00157B70FD|nr:WGR domain-containing protein [Acidiphilium sp. C61]
MQLALFPEQISLIRVRPEHNEKRYYQIEIVTDLFGAVGLARTWGRIGRSAHSRFDPLPDLGTAIDALRRLARAKRRRGYQDYPSTGWI